MSAVPIPIKTEEVILDGTDYQSTEELDEELQLQLEDSGGESYHHEIQYHSEDPAMEEETTTTTVTVTPARQRSAGQSHRNSMSGKTSSSGGGGPASKNALESEKRIRREIANSNERRRMQSINAGFQNLRSLLPRNEGEKLSKAAILQQTAQYILELENQKTQLLSQNSQLKRQLGQQDSSSALPPGAGDGGGGDGIEIVTIKKRKLADNIISVQTISDSSDEGLGSMSPEPMTLLNAANSKSQAVSGATLLAHKEILELKKQLENERRLRMLREEEVQSIKRQLFSVATAPTGGSGGSTSTTTYIPREVIEHTDNLLRDQLVEELPPGTVSYVEVDELGQQQVVVCSSIEELDSETAAAAADMITEDNVHEEVILSSNSSTESEQEVSAAIAKAYADGGSPSQSVLQPILQAAIKAKPKVEVERINETAILRVKAEKIDQPAGLTRSRQNLETIVEAIRHLEGDHLFGDVAEQHKLAKSQEAPLALTNKHAAAVVAQRHTLAAELRPFLQLKKKQVTVVGGTPNSTATVLTKAAAAKEAKNAVVTPTAILKVQTTNATSANSSGRDSSGGAQQITITTSALKQCRPGVIVAKQISS